MCSLTHTVLIPRATAADYSLLQVGDQRPGSKKWNPEGDKGQNGLCSGRPVSQKKDPEKAESGFLTHLCPRTLGRVQGPLELVDGV